MYKTSVYTLVKGSIEELAHRKQQKITKSDIIQQHTDTQSVWCGQYHLLRFLLFSMYKSLNVAINKCINWCFLHFTFKSHQITQPSLLYLDAKYLHMISPNRIMRH